MCRPTHGASRAQIQHGRNKLQMEQSTVQPRLVNCRPALAEEAPGCWVARGSGTGGTVDDEGHEGGHGVHLLLLAVLLVAQGVVDRLVHLARFMLRAQGLGFRVQGSGFKVECLFPLAHGSWLTVYGSEIRVQGSA